jgi:hypothetical protein
VFLYPNTIRFLCFQLGDRLRVFNPKRLLYIFQSALGFLFWLDRIAMHDVYGYIFDVRSGVGGWIDMIRMVYVIGRSILD